MARIYVHPSNGAARIGIASRAVAVLLCCSPASYAATPNWSGPAATNSGLTQPLPAQRPSSAPTSRPQPPTQQKTISGTTGSADPKKIGNAPLLLRLLRQPDNVTATINGHSISAGTLRAQLRAAVAKVRKPTHSTAARKKEPVPGASELARQNDLMLAAIKKPPSADDLRVMKLAASLPPDASGPGAYKVQTVANSDAVVTSKPCPERGPGIIETKDDTLTPGGMVAFRASCLGANPGEVHMFGDFPGGDVKLRVDLWTDESVAATVPAELSGVLDQRATVQLVRGDGRKSNPRRLPFVARRALAQMPVPLISIVGCAQNAYCSANTISHGATTGDDQSNDSGDLSGSDTWKIGVGNGWVLQSVSFDSTDGATLTAAGFEKDDPASTNVNVAWAAVNVGSMDADNSALADIFRPFSVPDKIYFYEAAYTLSVSAVGPVGVSPDPSVKPPYVGKGGAGGPRSTTTVQNVQLGNSGKPAGSDHVTPDWNTPASGNSNGGGTSVSGTTFHQKQLPGSWTTPQPGAPVESPLGGRK